jgi:hypothetical protein
MQHKEAAMHPLPIVGLVIGLFLLCALTLTALILGDWLAERRLRLPKQDALQLNLESLIGELTVYG